MNLLLVNDDGIFAEGLVTLAKELSKEHNIIVVAPDRQMSGASHSISFYKELTLSKVELGQKIEAYSLSGTPADCVKLALKELCKDREIDVVISGINDSLNIGTDISYSGTIGAAFEGAIMGKKSIAVSSYNKDNDFSFASKFVKNNLHTFMNMTKCTSTILSVNFPSTIKEEIKGIKAAPVGVNRYNDEYILKNDAFYLIGDPIKVDNPEHCDVEYIREGYIVITPLTIQFTDVMSMDRVQDESKKLCW